MHKRSARIRASGGRVRGNWCSSCLLVEQCTATHSAGMDGDGGDESEWLVSDGIVSRRPRATIQSSWFILCMVVGGVGVVAVVLLAILGFGVCAIHR